MIRTNSVTLSVMPALAYRQKFPSGGSGVVVLRADATQPGVASISKTSGEPIISANTPADLYPVDAFREAIELTAGMPYRKQGKPRLVAQDLQPQAVVEEEQAEEDLTTDNIPEIDVVIDSDEYQAIVDAYTDKDGKLSYALINKELIQVAHNSEMVRRMVEAGDSEQTIRLFVVGNRFRAITGNKNLTDEQVLKMAELLDEVSPKGVFKEFNAELRVRMGAQKRR
ncbi:MAG: hypothetical protein QM302_09660 [Acidobacteriota bacterium]|nr:hypothetical protein [Acidobacteriota bacterium]